MSELVTRINELAKEVHEHNVRAGWWKDMNRDFYQTAQLVSTEISEATEGERKNLMDDKLPHRKMGEVELADALIRLLDLAGRYGWVYSPVEEVDYTPLMRMRCVAARHFICNSSIIALGIAWYTNEFEQPGEVMVEEFNEIYSICVAFLLRTAEIERYDVMGALYEKFTYNKTRPDHTPEARAQEHGAKF